MISRVYRLVDTKRVEMVLREVEFGDDSVLTAPDYLSICAADQRYYFGKRSREILKIKLPMALIHEATATVLYDNSGRLDKGSKAVLVPLIETARTSGIKSNYDPANPYVSSGVDGFISDYVAVQQSRLIPIEGDYLPIYVFSELLSVAINALEAFDSARLTDAGTVGIWGDGNMGYIISLALRCLYPDIEIIVVGKTLRKIQRFAFADQTYTFDEVPHGISVNHAFECVGGSSSEAALKQMFDITMPQGCISLLGVSEEAVPINTRTVLEKGFRIIGNNRSNADDMKKAVSLIQDSDTCKKYLTTLISEIVKVKEEKDISHAFEQSSLNDFKTIMKMEL